ncbi:leukocyte elastase inhibitor [Reticulomyxa filosa]|uniref:Leukocyte elastase inhibitor n=1 Tax=Reticulomyxa filosa TaxID=46433 RepID=X6M407_RETFI|nr:leukocyte elastase inhibitor [Reticulomyxa filosa]|eukprot:ETO08346.1 leukocyte elastase inhibitor [Reticulomyxa filosa]
MKCKKSLEQLTTYEQKSYPRFVNLNVPKFKCETLTTPISNYQSMGINKAFNTSADFDDMFDDKGITYIKGIYHKALIEVDEKGTVAAAVTAIVTKSGCCMGTETELQPLEIIFDSPFDFYIYDSESHIILFSGYFC